MKMSKYRVISRESVWLIGWRMMFGDVGLRPILKKGDGGFAWPCRSLVFFIALLAI